MYLEHPAGRMGPSKEFASIPPVLYEYIANNCFAQLNITSLTKDNINHVMDCILAYRECFNSLMLDELVDQTNYCLDVLAEFLPDVTGKNKTQHRNNLYRFPHKENIEVFSPKTKRLGTKNEERSK